jgi:hypothetical protein
MELREKQALLFERVHRRRMSDGISKTRVVAISKVIGHDEDDVGFTGGRITLCPHRKWEEQDKVQR